MNEEDDIKRITKEMKAELQKQLEKNPVLKKEVTRIEGLQSQISDQLYEVVDQYLVDVLKLNPNLPSLTIGSAMIIALQEVLVSLYCQVWDVPDKGRAKLMVGISNSLVEVVEEFT